MLDNILIVITILFLVIQLIVACQLSFLVAKSKKEGGIVVTNFWFNSIPYILLFYTVIMLAYALKTNDTMLLLLPMVLSMCFLFDMHIFYANGEKVMHYYFLLQKNVCTSVDVNEKLIIAEFGDKKAIVSMSYKKVELLKSYLKIKENNTCQEVSL